MTKSKKNGLPTETTIKQKAARVAQELEAHLQDAVGDIASDMLSPNGGMLDDKWAKWIKAARKAGVQDVLGSLADALYNDPDTIQDCIGDKLYDACPTPEERTAVLDNLARHAFPGLLTAIAALRQE